MTTFVDNTATYGGAFFVKLGSFVLWDGVTSFVNNIADEGGAFCANNSTVLWDGVTSFVDNMAHLHGGAFCVYQSSIVSWNGVTSFVENVAHMYGGALYVFDDSIILWNGETTFDNNAAQNGGAFCAYHSSIISWVEVTTFVNNVAHQGGAFYAYFAFVSWVGETSFIANNASSSGGAVYVASSSNITMGGDNYFIENKAGEDGGAAYVYVDHDYDTPSYISVDNNSTVLFQSNACGGNGGATAFIGEVITRFAPNMTFMGNNAGIAGGAVYMLGSNNGMTFEGTRFISNSAVIGGGLYSTGNGIAVTEDAEGNLEYYPTTLIECKFVENKAKKTGGAIDSSAGRDMIVNTSFVGNIASLGGALRLVGTASLIGCTFVENLSGEKDGPGISNDGVILFMSNCSFIDNAYNCRTGFFLDYDEMSPLFETVCKGCDVPCSGCTFEGQEPICLGELGHSTSAGGNTTLESLLIERGYWRATNTSMEILACYNAEACFGGLTGRKGYCNKGYKGPYCSVCSKGYTASLGFACNKCSNNATGGIALAVVMAVVIVFAFAAFLSYVLSGEMEDADRGIVVRVTRFIPLNTVKIVIVVWQIVTQFSAVANVVFPSVYQKFLDGLDILNFDITWVFSTKCIIDTDFHDQLLLATLGPLVCIAILGSTYVVAMHQNRASERARGIVRRKHVSMLLLLTFLVYSPASSTLFKTFACEELDDGRIYLRADYRIMCDSFKHKALEIYAAFMGVVYVLGIPAFYGILLSSNREALIKNAGREGDERIKPITHLWKPYTPDRFYYEVIECVRRVSLTGALVFIYPNTAAQIAVALMMAVFFMIASEALAPYESPWDTWCSRTGHAIIYTSMFLALLLKVDVSGERASSQRVFESVLIAAHLCLILIVVVEAVVLIVAWSKEVKEHTEPQIHPGLSSASSRVFRDRAALEDSDEVLPPFQHEGFKG